MMIPKKLLGHFIGWFVVTLIIFYLFHDVLYWYAVAGSFLVAIIYYVTFFSKKYFFPAILGWALSLVLTYYLI